MAIFSTCRTLSSGAPHLNSGLKIIAVFRLSTQAMSPLRQFRAKSSAYSVRVSAWCFWPFLLAYLYPVGPRERGLTDGFWRQSAIVALDALIPALSMQSMT